MGYQGEMWGIKASKLSYYAAFSYLCLAVIILLKSFFKLYQSRQLIKQYPSQIIDNKEIKILDSSFPYAAQIGFWRSQLVISKGLIELLSPEHLKAVIAHETAHEIYRDPFFFFWLFYFKKISFWLPNNEKLWQNLLLLRELRADQTAAKQVDFLLIAESLINVTLAMNKEKKSLQLALQCPFYDNCLEVRINNLLENQNQLTFSWWQVTWLVLIFIPYTFLPFHTSC
jgi:Zn-dependent protease with chaperone function